MKRLSERNLLRSVIVAGVATAAICVWATVSESYSVANAVPAGPQHATEVVRWVPDDSHEDTLAANFTSVKFMTRGYCYAASQAIDWQAPGGFGGSKNAARPVDRASRGKGLFLLAQPGVVTQFGKATGMGVVLVNRTDHWLVFHASDSRLAIVQEAQYSDGTWRPIEYLPSSWCGNSSHRVFLAPSYFWQFAAPRYQGEIKTKLRFCLTLADGSHAVSNVFDGSINPEQFTLKEGHQATQVMDSYVD